MVRPLARWRAASALCLALPLVFVAGAASAQENFPDRGIRIVVPFSAGGGVDAVARIIGERMREPLRQSLLVDNKPGASGMIGALAVAKSPADGYTLLLASAGEVAVNPHLYKNMQYAPDRDFAPVSLVVRVPNVVVVNPELPIRNMAELVAYAKANPGALSYSSSGVGNPQHLAGELLGQMAGIKLIHAPYKGSAQQVADVAAKNVGLTFSSLAGANAFIKDGRVRAIAMTSPGRSPLAADLPAVAEYAPLKGYALENWFGLFAPAKTPAPVIARLNAALAEALRDPEVIKKLRLNGGEPQAMSPADFAAFVRGESARFGKIVADAKITVDN